MATSNSLIPPVQRCTLPLSLDDDLTVCFQQVSPTDGVTPVDFAAGTTVTLAIDATPAISSAATISGSSAYVYVSAATVNPVPSGTLWRVLVTTAPGDSSPAVTKVPANGRVVRYDG